MSPRHISERPLPPTRVERPVICTRPDEKVWIGAPPGSSFPPAAAATVADARDAVSVEAIWEDDALLDDGRKGIETGEIRCA